MLFHFQRLKLTAHFHRLSWALKLFRKFFFRIQCNVNDEIPCKGIDASCVREVVATVL